MRRLSAAILVAGLSLGFSHAASAADMPVKAPYAAVPVNWSGFYVGATVGGIWAEDTLSASGFAAPTSHFASVLGGGTAGINWQTGHWVLGLEGDYSLTGINSTVNFGCGPAACYEKMSYFATARGRAGYAVDRFLYFVSGGAAFSKSATVQAGVDSGTGHINGWTVGAGVEAAIDNHWSVKVEYLYADFGKPTFDDVGVPVTHDIKDNIARIGLNYRLIDGLWGK